MTTANPQRSESAFLRELRARLAPPSHVDPASVRVPRDFVDDMAALPSSEGLLWTCDMLMEGVDFDSAQHGWRDIGAKAMAVNLSDCAAMAVRPVAALCAVSLSNALTLEDALELVEGAHDFGLRYGCPIVGGDTNSWNHPTVVSITVAGRAEAGLTPVGREGALPGDTVCVTGPLGGSLLGRHLHPQPRIELALELRRRWDVHAMLDISDGLALDLWRVLEASDCGAVLDAAALNRIVHPDAVRRAAETGQTPRAHALHDGEDFELIVILPESAAADAARELGVHRIGRIERGEGLRLVEPDGTRTPVPRRGWEHFQQ